MNPNSGGDERGRWEAHYWCVLVMAQPPSQISTGGSVGLSVRSDTSSNGEQVKGEEPGAANRPSKSEKNDEAGRKILTHMVLKVVDFRVQIAENMDAALDKGSAVVGATAPSSTEYAVSELPDRQFTKLNVRARFEIFKRDDFACRYCGRRTPDVVLEVDHVVPRCDGGSDDPMNLVTSCWDCNRGKAGVPLSHVLTGEDPHDKAIELLERERQLKEYNQVIARERYMREEAAWRLAEYWLQEQGSLTSEQKTTGNWTIGRQDFSWLKSALKWCPEEQIKEFMDAAIGRQLTKNMRYVAGCCRNWRYEQAAHQSVGKGYSDDGAY